MEEQTKTRVLHNPRAVLFRMARFFVRHSYFFLLIFLRVLDESKNCFTFVLNIDFD